MITINNIEYNILCTFIDNNKEYIIYTDNKEDEDGFIKTFSGILETKDGNNVILPLKTDEEIEKINAILNSLTKEE